MTSATGRSPCCTCRGIPPAVSRSTGAQRSAPTAARGLLLSGDTAYAAPLYAYSPDAEPDAYRASLRRLADLAPQVRTCLPSHDETPMPPALLVAMADAFDRIHDGVADDALIGLDDEAGHDHPYDLYDFGPFQVRMRRGWGREQRR